MSNPSTRLHPWLFAATGVMVAAAYLGSTRWWGALLSSAILAWFAWSGVRLAKCVLSSAHTRAHWLLGPVWGLCGSLVGLLALWWAGGRGWLIVAIAPWPVWLATLLARRWRTEVTLPTFDRRDAAAVALLVCLVPVIAGLPYAHVGEYGRDGSRAYRAYFTADFVWAMTVVAEVSKGDLPPKNPFQVDGKLHYYWLAHFLSAVEHRLTAPLGLTMEEVILANSLGFSLVFVAFLYGFVRAFGAGPWPAAAACALAFLANSFEALDRIVVWWREPSLYPLLTDINIDAVTRWFYSSMPVDGLHRMVLYQPHHLPGYAVGLSAFLVVSLARDVTRARVALFAGIALGLSLLLTSFTAIMFGLAVGVVYAVRLRRPADWRCIPACVLLGAAPVAAAFEASRFLSYIDPAARSILMFGPNPVALDQWRYALVLSFGPLLLTGAAGAAVIARRRSQAGVALLILAAVALLFYFDVDVPDMQHVWVGWRAGHVLFIAATAMTGILLTWALEQGRVIRRAVFVTIAALALLAAPTVAIDIFNAQDIANFGQGPSFPWTLRLMAEEVEALQWIRTHTPAEVIVQIDALERGSASWGYMTAFGERRMAAGLPIAMIPFQPYRNASELVGDKVFNRGSAEKRSAIAQELGIDYLYVGPVERERHPDLTALLDSRSDLFPVVFRNREVVIYWVAPSERR